MKKVRMLLRVSSNQQLEADGDLEVQRSIVKDYIEQHPEWQLDTDKEKEYFEGSKSAYKNSVTDRDILQKALTDAKKKEYDILVAYKDDRIGRRMWEICDYVMALKKYGVDVYTVKDGCISPQDEDKLGDLMLAIRYWNAEKSSTDTGMRVRDNAQKLVQSGRFMGGKAPYGYELVNSDVVSKHGRLLKKLVIIPERAEVVRYIYELSLNKEYGSAKIALTLNNDEIYRHLTPTADGVWKGGTITSILTNPIYAGYVAYTRRERTNGQYHRLNNDSWIISEKKNEDIVIIDEVTWNKVQVKRTERGQQFTKKLENQDVTVLKRNDGMLALLDVIHCGYCGGKLLNGSKYNYWTIKETGERRTSKIPAYKCQNAWQGVPHNNFRIIRADKIEPIVFRAIAEYIGKLQENEDIFEQRQNNQNREKKEKERFLQQLQNELRKIRREIAAMEERIPSAIMGEYALSLEYLTDLIDKHKHIEKEKEMEIGKRQSELDSMAVSIEEWEDVRKNIPTWQEIFLSADTSTKRVLVNRLIERIDVKRDQIVVLFKIDLNNFLSQSRMKDNDLTILCTRDSA